MKRSPLRAWRPAVPIATACRRSLAVASVAEKVGLRHPERGVLASVAQHPPGRVAWTRWRDRIPGAHSEARGELTGDRHFSHYAMEPHKGRAARCSGAAPSFTFVIGRPRSASCGSGEGRRVTRTRKKAAEEERPRQEGEKGPRGGGRHPTSPRAQPATDDNQRRPSDERRPTNDERRRQTTMLSPDQSKALHTTCGARE